MALPGYILTCPGCGHTARSEEFEVSDAGECICPKCDAELTTRTRLNMPDAKHPDLSSLEWWTVRELANLLRYDRSTILRWCESGKIKAVKMPGGTWRIHKSVVEELQRAGLPEQRRMETATPGPEWQSSSNYFEDEPSKARART